MERERVLIFLSCPVGSDKSRIGMVAELLRHGECKTRAYNSGPWLSPDQGIGGEGGGG